MGRKPKRTKKKSEDTQPMVTTADPDAPATPAVWRPGADPMEEDEALDYDPTAYACLHPFSLDWPCLSFDLLRDELGAGRTAFPHSLYLAAGTQAAHAKQNQLALVKLAGLGQGRHGSRRRGSADSGGSSSSSSSEDEGEDDAPPQMHLRMLPLSCGVNRVRAQPEQPGVVAVSGDDGRVQIYDTSAVLDDLRSCGIKPSRSQTVQLQPRCTHRQAAEGYALDWSPAAAGQLASGDCAHRIHVWTPDASSAGWAVSKPLKGHSGSVEDLQWSPTESNVLASCSVDRTIRIWDTREHSRSMLSVTASGTDVNVISWCRLTSYILASGDDAGVLRVWDLRSFADGAHVANLEYHRGPITSIEWAAHENSVVATSSSDGQLAVWDLAVERDPEEEAAIAPESNAQAPQDLPPQLMFVHAGQQDIKELHWHGQIPGMLASTAADGFNVFKPANV